MKVKICAAQMSTVALGVKENTEKAELLARLAAKEGCDIMLSRVFFDRSGG